MGNSEQCLYFSKQAWLTCVHCGSESIKIVGSAHCWYLVDSVSKFIEHVHLMCVF